MSTTFHHHSIKNMGQVVDFTLTTVARISRRSCIFERDICVKLWVNIGKKWRPEEDEIKAGKQMFFGSLSFVMSYCFIFINECLSTRRTTQHGMDEREALSICVIKNRHEFILFYYRFDLFLN